MVDLSFEIQSGTLIAWRGKNLFSKIVQIFTRSSFSHVGIAVEFGGKFFVIDAKEGKGVQITPLFIRLPFYVLVPGEKCEVYEWNERTERLSLNRIGEKYSFIKCIKSYFKKKLKKNETWECAELATYILTSMGYKLSCCNTPQRLVDRMLSIGFFLVKVSGFALK